MSEFTLTVQGRVRRGDQPEAADTAIVRADPAWYVGLGSAWPGQERALLVDEVGKLLRAVSEHCAADLGRRLHHAVWTITGDPAEVSRLGLHDPACEQCREGTLAALDYLAGGPGREVAVGQMWWIA